MTAYIRIPGDWAASPEGYPIVGAGFGDGSLEGWTLALDLYQDDDGPVAALAEDGETKAWKDFKDVVERDPVTGLARVRKGARSAWISNEDLLAAFHPSEDEAHAQKEAPEEVPEEAPEEVPDQDEAAREAASEEPAEEPGADADPTVETQDDGSLAAIFFDEARAMRPSAVGGDAA